MLTGKKKLANVPYNYPTRNSESCGGGRSHICLGKSGKTIKKVGIEQHCCIEMEIKLCIYLRLNKHPLQHYNLPQSGHIAPSSITFSGFSLPIQNLSILGCLSRFPQSTPGCYRVFPTTQLPSAILSARSLFSLSHNSAQKLQLEPTLIAPTTFLPHNIKSAKSPREGIFLYQLDTYMVGAGQILQIGL